jgi:hypothetical protein
MDVDKICCSIYMCVPRLYLNTGCLCTLWSLARAKFFCCKLCVESLWVHLDSVQWLLGICSSRTKRSWCRMLSTHLILCWGQYRLVAVPFVPQVSSICVAGQHYINRMCTQVNVPDLCMTIFAIRSSGYILQAVSGFIT